MRKIKGLDNRCDHVTAVFEIWFTDQESAIRIVEGAMMLGSLAKKKMSAMLIMYLSSLQNSYRVKFCILYYLYIFLYFVNIFKYFIQVECKIIIMLSMAAWS